MGKINKVQNGLTGVIIMVMGMLFITSTCSATSYPTSTATQLGTDLSMNQYKLTDTGDIISKGPWVDVRAYSSFSAAIDAIGTSNKTLLIPDSRAVTANKTVPANVTLAFLKGGFLNMYSDVTVTINGVIEAGPYQIFEGPGLVVTGDLCKEVWANWWGLATGNSASGNTSALQLAVASNRTVNIAAGTYNITHLGLGDSGVSGQDLWNCEIVGKGTVILQKSTTGTDVITMGEPDSDPTLRTTRAGHVSLRNLSIGATEAVTYGIRMMFATDCSFYNVQIAGTTITTGLYIDWSWENVFYNTSISCNNAVETHFNAVNNNSFWGGRWQGSTTSTTDIGIMFYGRSNLVQGVDFSDFNIGVYMSGSGGCAVNNCYFENNTTDVKTQASGEVRGLSIQGNNFMAAGSSSKSIVHDIAVTSFNVVITGNHFEGYDTAISITGFCNGWVIMGNNFDNCTNRVSGIGQYTFSSVSNGTTNGELRWHGENRENLILTDSFLDHMGRRLYRLDRGDASGTVTIDSVSNLAGSSMAFVKVRAMGRMQADVTKSFEIIAVINNNGTLSSWSKTYDNGSGITAVQISGGNLQVTTLNNSEWVFWIESDTRRVW